MFLVFSMHVLIMLAHPWKSQHYVIIDTDGGLDDFRTISLLLASPDVRVLAITTSDGVLDARTTYHKVRSLLNDLNHQGLAVGSFSNSNAKKNHCLPAMQFEWGVTCTDSIVPPDALSVVSYIFDNHQGEHIDYVCLGGLSTIRHLCEQRADFSSKVEEIIWSSPFKLDADNFNYCIDKISVNQVVEKKLPLIPINTASFSHYNDALVYSIKAISNVYALKVSSSIEYKNTSYAKAFCDEAVAIFLHYPDLFEADTVDGLVGFQMRESTKDSDIQSAYQKILSGETVNQHQVLSVFPLDTVFYFSDVQPIAHNTIKIYGKEEWVAGVMANEMHRHLGVYSIIGVKMGIRAKEYFNAGIDEMTVVSHAGTIPPFSCMNDGLQVSTGATLGHGLIKIASEDQQLPMADFSYMNRTIRVSLKADVRKKVETEIKELSKIYGLDSDIYWDLVRNKAIRYWTAFDRHEIFTIEVL